MNRLNRDARALVERTRGLHEPSAEDRAAVRRAIALQLPAAAIASSVLAQTAPAAAGGVASGLHATLVVKWLIGGVLLGSLGVGVATLERPTHDKPVAAASEPVQILRPAVVAPVHAAVPETVAEVPSAVEDPRAPDVGPRARATPSPSNAAALVNRALSTTSEPSARATRAEFAVPVAEASAAAPPPPRSAVQTPDELLREARALRTAQAALSDGRAHDALELLRLQSLQFPTGALQEERSAARLIALCTLGRTDSARPELTRFLEVSKNSPLAPRVLAACTKR